MTSSNIPLLNFVLCLNENQNTMKMNIENNAGGKLEFNDQFARAYDTLENTWHNVLIVGKAGTGKSTILQYFRSNTLKNVVVLAPTGVAAVNIKGQTIHSFFRFRPDITIDTVASIKMWKKNKELYKNIDTIIIDEVSMVRADLLDCVDEFMRLHGKKSNEPFGGVQMIFIGDLYQLPPVVTGRERSIFRDLYKSPYFFDSKVFRKLFNSDSYQDNDDNFEFSYDSLKIVELDKIYRQKEESFIELLGAIRNRSITDAQLAVLNKRYIPGFKPKRDDFYIYLTTTNYLADNVNEEQINRINSPGYFSDGEISGKFEQKNLPTQFSLQMKVGAQVMLLNNDPSGRWVNGSIGKIVSFVEDDQIIFVELSNGNIVEVTPFKWEMYKFSYNPEIQMIESETVGSFRQYPLRLAWAITIHKSQGKTFSKAIVDIGDGTFSHGQIYVALSRCITLSGIVLKKPILRRHILLDKTIVKFMQECENYIASENAMIEKQ